LQNLKKISHIWLKERYEISALKKQGLRNSDIAKSIGRHKSTIGRELDRNADGRSMEYRPDLAQRKTASKHEEKSKHKAFTPEVRERVTYWLKEDYSPEQIKDEPRRITARVFPQRAYTSSFGRTKGWWCPL